MRPWPRMRGAGAAGDVGLREGRGGAAGGQRGRCPRSRCRLLVPRRGWCLVAALGGNAGPPPALRGHPPSCPL